MEQLRFDELPLRLAQLCDHLLQLRRVTLLALHHILDHLQSRVVLLNALQGFQRFLLKSGNSLGVLLPVLLQKWDQAQPVLHLFAQGCQFLLRVQKRLADSALFCLAQLYLFVKPGQALELTTNLVQGPRRIIALDGPHPFLFPLLLLAPIVGLGKHLYDFVLQLLDRRFELAETKQLALNARQSALQVFEGA